LLALAIFTFHSRRIRETIFQNYPSGWQEVITGYVYCCISRLADRNSEICTWTPKVEQIGHTFTKYALPMTWDFVEVMPWADSSGGFLQAVEWVSLTVGHLLAAIRNSNKAEIKQVSAVSFKENQLDFILTDPPYYDAIPYSDLMDFFYIWLRRSLHGMSPEIDSAFAEKLSPKWSRETNDGEIIDDSSRHGGNKQESKEAYEAGMSRAFHMCYKSLTTNGRLVVVFAHKHPDAWETLVSSIIRTGFVVVGSWPIQTERVARTRSLSSAALASSVWLVCKKRPETARPGWDNVVLEAMRERIGEQLREFWDAGIRGPDFVWAATGPALEAFSRHPVVKKANEPGQLMTVAEFLRQARRIVVDFVVGRVLSPAGGAEETSGLDDVTTYYLLHRHDFGTDEAPVGACILYAISCGLSDRMLVDQFEILSKSGGDAPEEETDDAEADEAETEVEESSGSKVKLRQWNQRKRKTLGYEAPGGRPVPLIDQIHRLMHLWKAGDVVKVDEYLDTRGLRRSTIFQQVLQALIELAQAGSDERALLESLSNHVTALGVKVDRKERRLFEEG
jgi:hypothetical protein